MAVCADTRGIDPGHYGQPALSGFEAWRKVRPGWPFCPSVDLSPATRKDFGAGLFKLSLSGSSLGLQTCDVSTLPLKHRPQKTCQLIVPTRAELIQTWWCMHLNKLSPIPPRKGEYLQNSLHKNEGTISMSTSKRVDVAACHSPHSIFALNGRR